MWKLYKIQISVSIKYFLEQACAYLFTYCLWLLSVIITCWVAEIQTTWHRNPKIFTLWPLIGLLTPDLDESPFFLPAKQREALSSPQRGALQCVGPSLHGHRAGIYPLIPQAPSLLPSQPACWQITTKFLPPFLLNYFQTYHSLLLSKFLQPLSRLLSL